MTDRERLLEILNKPIFPHENVDPLEAVADYLLDNGVTFAKGTNVPSWIPVTERLPEMHVKVLCCGIRGGRFIAELTTWGNGSRIWDKRNGRGCPEVTHWMPLSEPPKEE